MKDDIDLFWGTENILLLYLPEKIKKVITVFDLVCQKNQIRNILKNFGATNAVKGIFISIIFDVFRTFFYLYQLRFDYLKAVWKGNLDILGELPPVNYNDWGCSLQ